MEKGLARLREAAVCAADITQKTGDLVKVEAMPAGVRCAVIFEVEGKHYTHENLTPWQALHPTPNTNNPLIAALDSVMRKRTEFDPNG